MEKEIDIKGQAIKSLKEILKSLSENTTDIGSSALFNEIKMIREIMEILDRYDWKDYHSEYAREKDGKMIKEVATWEQDSNKQIRNHKTYIIEEYPKIFEKYKELNLDQLGTYQCFCEDAMTAVFAKVDKETNTLDYKNVISLANYATEGNEDNNLKKLKELYKEYDILNPRPEIDFSKYTEEQREEINKMLDEFNKKLNTGSNNIGNALKSIMVRIKKIED